MVPLRFLRGWDRFEPGQEVSYPHPGAAEELIRRGIAEAVAPAVTPDPQTETAKPKGRNRGTGAVHS